MKQRRDKMRSLFVLKSSVPYDSDIFENMRSRAVEMLCCAEPLRNTQAIVLFSKQGKEYSTVLEDACTKEKAEEAAFLERLKASEDTEIACILCMWCDNSIDLPSYDFRKMLSSLNSKNSDTLIFVMTTDGASAIKLSETMK
jgi:hypothetical protein